MLIAPFFRASVTIAPPDRQLWGRGVPAEVLYRRLRAADEIFRQNLRRLFAAARLAEATGGQLVFVEGYRSNRVLHPSRPERFASGSWIFAALLRGLRRRGLIGRVALPLRRDISRCTSEEARAIATLGPGSAIVGIADAPCPSSIRARRYLIAHAPAAEVVTPTEALQRAGSLSPDQSLFWQAIAPTDVEKWLGPALEAPNWGLHVLSQGVRMLLAPPVLEERLAHRLRVDRP